MSASPLRLAEVRDLPAIVEIYNSTIPGRMVTADTEPVTVESRKGWFADHEPSKRPLWVLEENGQIAAWLSYSNFHPRPAYVPTVELSIYVHEDHRRKGYGRMLLSEAIERAPQHGAKTLVGLIYGHNEPSLTLFRAFGFETWGHLPRVAVMDGIERDLVIVGKRVG